jgi:predicted nucleic acid-binding Zn ribbon protein
VQADELRQLHDWFQRITATRAEVIEVIGRKPVAPYAARAA